MKVAAIETFPLAAEGQLGTYGEPHGFVQLAPCDGWVTVPSGPGLGVEVDEEALRFFRISAAGSDAGKGPRPHQRLTGEVS